MSESYSGQQFVGIDLHRRRSVIVRMTTDGDPLECIRISNDAERLATVMARAGESPEVVLEATQELVLGGRRPAGAGRSGASGASVGRQGI